MISHHILLIVRQCSVPRFYFPHVVTVRLWVRWPRNLQVDHKRLVGSACIPSPGAIYLDALCQDTGGAWEIRRHHRCVVSVICCCLCCFWFGWLHFFKDTDDVWWCSVQPDTSRYGLFDFVVVVVVVAYVGEKPETSGNSFGSANRQAVVIIIAIFLVSGCSSEASDWMSHCCVMISKPSNAATKAIK